MMDVFRRIKSLIEHRELLIRLAFRDLKVRYRAPLLGFLWAFLVPLFTIIIFKLIFYNFMKIRTGIYPFFIYLMTAIIPWSFFQGSVSVATASISGGGDLIKKVYFSREIIPISTVVANLLNFLPTLVVMLIFLFVFRMKFTPLILLLPAVVLLHFILTVGFSLVVSALYPRYRDIKYIIEILLMALFYLTPAFYPLDMVFNFSETIFKIYIVNPFVGMLILYRITLLKGYMDTLPMGVNLFHVVCIPLISAIAILFFGFWVFRRHEATFADYI